jgi:hypothetical protein
MTPDEIARMPSAQIDELIAMAAKERAKRPDPHPAEAPKHFDATFNPAWLVFLAGENTIVQIKHLAHGWVSIAIPPAERAHLLALFLQHSLTAAQGKGEGGAAGMAPVPPSAGGGTVH